MLISRLKLFKIINLCAFNKFLKFLHIKLRKCQNNNLVNFYSNNSNAQKNLSLVTTHLKTSSFPPAYLAPHIIIYLAYIYVNITRNNCYEMEIHKKKFPAFFSLPLSLIQAERTRLETLEKIFKDKSPKKRVCFDVFSFRVFAMEHCPLTTRFFPLLTQFVIAAS